MEGEAFVSNNTCPTDFAVEATIYRKVMGTIVFVIVWPFIVLDFKFFPIGRPAAALVGATLMVLFVIVPQEEVYHILGEEGNLQTLCLLIGMMILSYYYDREGLLSMLVLRIYGKNKLFRHILWKVCVLSAILSAVITNDATCLVITPILLKEHISQGRSRKELGPMLLGIATSANIGSAATFFGNPQNAFIAANSDVSLVIFFAAALPAAILGMTINIAFLHLSYFRVLFKKRDLEESLLTNRGEDDSTTQLENRRDEAQTHEKSTPLLGSEQNSFNGISVSPVPAQKYGSINLSSNSRTTENKILERKVSPADAVDHSPRLLKNVPKSWRNVSFSVWLIVVTLIVVILLAIPPPPTVPVEFNLGLVPVGAGVMTMLVDTILNRKYASEAIQKIDWTVIMMFVGLFVWLGGFENTSFPKDAFSALLSHMELFSVTGVLLFTAFVIVGSNILSNVPLVILIVRELHRFPCGSNYCTSQLTGMLLAWVSTVAGNFTLIGSVANLIVAEKARSVVNYRLTFFEYLKFGFLSTIFDIFSGLPIVYFASRDIDLGNLQQNSTDLIF